MTPLAKKNGRQTAAEIRADGKIKYGNRWRTPAQIEKLKATSRKSSKQRQQRRAEDRKREAEQIQTGLLVDGQQSEAMRLKNSGWPERIEWVFAHLSYKHCPREVDGATRVLWSVAKKDPRSFMNKYLPLLLKKEKATEERDIEAERQGKEVKRIWEDILARSKTKPCPTCDGKGWRDEDFKAPKVVGPWFEKFSEGAGI